MAAPPKHQPYVPSRAGTFYVIQLEPHTDPGRVKLGFSTRVEKRLAENRCSAPYAQIVQTFDCDVQWEKTAIDFIAHGAERVHTEVFRFRTIDEVMRRARIFFARELSRWRPSVSTFRRRFCLALM